MQVLRAVQALLRPEHLAPLFLNGPPPSDVSSGDVSSGSGTARFQPGQLAASRHLAGLPFLAARVAAHLESIHVSGNDTGNLDQCLSPQLFPGGAEEEMGQFAMRAAAIVADFAAAADALLRDVQAEFGLNYQPLTDRLTALTNSIVELQTELDDIQSELSGSATTAGSAATTASSPVDFTSPDDADDVLRPLSLLALWNRQEVLKERVDSTHVSWTRVMEQMSKALKSVQAMRAATAKQREAQGKPAPAVRVSTSTAWYLIMWACQHIYNVPSSLAGEPCVLIRARVRRRFS